MSTSYLGDRLEIMWIGSMREKSDCVRKESIIKRYTNKPSEYEILRHFTVNRSYVYYYCIFCLKNSVQLSITSRQFNYGKGNIQFIYQCKLK